MTGSAKEHFLQSPLHETVSDKFGFMIIAAPLHTEGQNGHSQGPMVAFRGKMWTDENEALQVAQELSINSDRHIFLAYGTIKPCDSKKEFVNVLGSFQLIRPGIVDDDLRTMIMTIKK